YRAPELSEGQPASLSSDVYSLGLLLYELITGVRPVSGPDARAIALAHLSLRLSPLAHARPTLYLPLAEQLISRATARYPEHRYASASELSAALDGLWRDLGASTQRLTDASLRPGPTANPAPAASMAPAVSRPPIAAPADDAPAADIGSLATSRPRTRASSITSRLNRQLLPADGSPPTDKGHLVHGLMGWLVMIGLLVLVATGSYLGVNALIAQFSGISRPNLPSLPGLPSISSSDGPLAWLGGFFKHDEIYIVNLAEGLNLRSQPGINDDTTVVTVIPNGTPVTKLDGPVVKDNIPWLRVSADVGGTYVEGWMSLNYLRQEQ
ncbi:MAG: SH3 domain-containing protein, partial [Oscillochloris sp.]|nr:SH3 domain-containing protein [Oscillochloris sp.]